MSFVFTNFLELILKVIILLRIEKKISDGTYLDSATIPEVIPLEADWAPNLHEATIIGFIMSY